MSVSNYRHHLSIASLFALVGCMTPEQIAEQEAETARLESEIAARTGEPADRICPRSSDSWEALDDDRILLEAGDNWYIAELIGTCDPDSAFTAIATRSSLGSLCLRPGDNVYTGLPRSGGRCVISTLHIWDKQSD